MENKKQGKKKTKEVKGRDTERRGKKVLRNADVPSGSSNVAKGRFIKK